MASKTTTTADRIETDVLKYMQKEGSIASTWEYAGKNKERHEQIIGVLKSLASDFFVVMKSADLQFYSIKPEGQAILDAGVSPEFQVYSKVGDSESITMEELRLRFKDNMKLLNIGFGKAQAARLLKMDKKTKEIKRATNEGKDETVELLKNVDKLTPKQAKVLAKRKLIVKNTVRFFVVTKGPEFQIKRIRVTPMLLEEHLRQVKTKKSKKKTSKKKNPDEQKKEQRVQRVWETIPKWKPAKIDVFGAPVSGGYLHPLMKVRSEFRKVLLQMGFEEMPTNQWVESAFWNFDALFQPQFHPARDAHDTFFIRPSANGDEQKVRVPEDYLKRVKDMHENGGGNVGNCKSAGYGYKWQRSEAEKLLLRTHTTAVSARMLYKLGQAFKDQKTFVPKKYFSIDRVFRNESMDKTHLCEFHQVEFFVADRGLSLGHLIGLLRTFFRLIGITKLRFKPAYNPYTEPSMEIFGYHPGLGKWTEVGNSGIFRPEMLSPMGIPSDVNVIAGGVSLERPTMIKYKYNDIRHMFSNAKADMKTNRGKVMARVIDCSGGATL